MIAVQLFACVSALSKSKQVKTIPHSQDKLDKLTFYGYTHKSDLEIETKTYTVGSYCITLINPFASSKKYM